MQPFVIKYMIKYMFSVIKYNISKGTDLHNFTGNNYAISIGNKDSNYLDQLQNEDDEIVAQNNSIEVVKNSNSDVKQITSSNFLSFSANENNNSFFFQPNFNFNYKFVGSIPISPLNFSL